MANKRQEENSSPGVVIPLDLEAQESQCSDSDSQVIFQDSDSESSQKQLEIPAVPAQEEAMEMEQEWPETISKDLEKMIAEGTVTAPQLRLQAKTLFLTYPRCDAEPSIVLARCKDYFKTWSPLLIVVAREQHQNQLNHLHVAVQLGKKCNVRANLLDALTGKHGNYQVARKFFAVVKYVCKEMSYVHYGEESLLKKYLSGGSSRQKTLMTDLATKIMAGVTLKTLNQENPATVLIHKKKLEDYIMWVELEKAIPDLKLWKLIVMQNFGNSQDEEIAYWLNKNIRQPRAFGQEQLYIYGPTKMGKTHLIRQLSEYLKIYYLPSDEEFYDRYEDGRYDLIVIDEFKSQKRLQWLNQFLDGSCMTLRKKGGQVLKQVNTAIIMISNYSLTECFHKCAADKLATIERRLQVVNVVHQINIKFQ